MTRFGAILAYDGTAYQGFQRQPFPTPTIQAAVEDALATISGEPVRIVAAGRTDAGVHATGQAIAFDMEWNHEDRDLQNAINSQLPLDIALQRVWRQAGFHPRFDALWRQYAYRIATVDVRQPLLNRHFWQLACAPLNIETMREAAALCLGELDFAAFGTPPQQGSSNTVRLILASRWHLQENEHGLSFIYRIRGSAFLYHMVRRLVGSMVQVGKGKLTVGEFEEILISRDLERAKVLAPPNGLVLEAVKYPLQAATAAIGDEAPLEEMV